MKYLPLRLLAFCLTFSLTAPASAQTLPDAKIQAIEEMLTQKMAKDQIPGLSIAIVMEGQVVWSKGYGLADLENQVPATPSTTYRTASIGKPITATAVMHLVEQGAIDLDAPIQQYCPRFPEKRWSITTRHLLSHTSGIRHYGGPRNEQELFNTKHYDSVGEALEIFENDPLLFEPGTAHQYSTFGYNLLGCVIEGASGTDFMSYLRQHIFEPAAMTATRDDDPAAIISNRAAGYLMTGEGTLENARQVDMSSKLPAGGFITTAPDLGRFAAAVMNHTLLSRATLEQMLTPYRLANGEVVDNGLGWGLFPDETWYGEQEAFHGGITPQVSGMLYLLPGRQFAVAIMMNLEGVSGRTGLAADIAKIALDLGS
ncbi:MAG TPA: serine hydrolase domain-containing protein [Rhodothermales bacterium]|nr:serine hydrolase domain-containing protein [Rhodothermales bacterium]